MNTVHRLAVSALSTRATALALAAVVTFGALASMGRIADVQLQQAESDLMFAQGDTETAPLQTIVITGHRLRKA